MTPRDAFLHHRSLLFLPDDLLRACVLQGYYHEWFRLNKFLYRTLQEIRNEYASLIQKKWRSIATWKRVCFVADVVETSFGTFLDAEDVQAVLCATTTPNNSWERDNGICVTAMACSIVKMLSDSDVVLQYTDFMKSTSDIVDCCVAKTGTKVDKEELAKKGYTCWKRATLHIARCSLSHEQHWRDEKRSIRCSYCFSLLNGDVVDGFVWRDGNRVFVCDYQWKRGDGVLGSCCGGTV